MLIFVQIVQVSRAQTTLESMKGYEHMSPTSAAVTSALLSGTTSLEDAGLTERSLAQDAAPQRQPALRRDGCLDSWKRLLGVDTFMATAMYGSGSQQARATRNPFSRGLISNFTDFFFDPSPVFGRRENGAAMLGGQRVNYTRLYDLSSSSLTRAERHDDQEAGHLSVVDNSEA